MPALAELPRRPRSPRLELAHDENADVLVMQPTDQLLSTQVLIGIPIDTVTEGSAPPEPTGGAQG